MQLGLHSEEKDQAEGRGRPGIWMSSVDDDSGGSLRFATRPGRVCHASLLCAVCVTCDSPA